MNHGRISSKVNRDCTIRVSCHRPGPCRIVPRKQAARHRTAGTHPPSHIHVQTSARRMGRAVETRRLQRPHLQHRRSSAEPRIPLRDRNGLAAFTGLRSESRAHGGGPAGAYGMHRRIRRHRFSGPGAGHRGAMRPGPEAGVRDCGRVRKGGLRVARGRRTPWRGPTGNRPHGVGVRARRPRAGSPVRSMRFDPKAGAQVFRSLPRCVARRTTGEHSGGDPRTPLRRCFGHPGLRR